MERQVFSVTELNNRIKGLLELDQSSIEATLGGFGDDAFVEYLEDNGPVGL